jgi:hypothetical protein
MGYVIPILIQLGLVGFFLIAIHTSLAIMVFDSFFNYLIYQGLDLIDCQDGIFICYCKLCVDYLE